MAFAFPAGGPETPSRPDHVPVGVPDGADVLQVGYPGDLRNDLFAYFCLFFIFRAVIGENWVNLSPAGTKILFYRGKSERNSPTFSLEGLITSVLG